jgi:hypothetical protein
MNFYEALKYPFQGKNWFRRILALALLQFVPIVGQLILFGYGIEVVRAIYSGEKNLPPIEWKRALGDGLRFLVAGLIYLTPLIGVVPTIATIGTNANGNLNLLGVGLASVLGLVILLISIALHIGGVRQAVENKGLFDPNGSAKLLLKNRAVSATLILNVILLSLIGIITTGLGLVLLLLPGAFVFVTCYLALWYLLANYGMEIGLDKTGYRAKKDYAPDLKLL